MNKRFFLAFAVVCFHFVFAQNKLNLSAIKENVNTVSSPYYYEKLVYKFNYDPNLIDSTEAKHLYYGKLFTDFTPLNINNKSSRNLSLKDLVDKKQFDTAIDVGEEDIRKFPADLEILGLLMYSYMQQGMEKKEITYLRAAQFKKMIDAVFSGNSGDNKHPVFMVTSVTDEYILAGILNLDLKDFRRRTEYNALGALDSFKKGKKKISFQVLYDKKLKN